MRLEDEVRQLVIDGERAAREARNPTSQRAALQPQYTLYLKVLVHGSQPKLMRAESYLRVVAAMRDDIVYADLQLSPELVHPSFEHIASSPLRVLAAYLERVPDTVVLVIERGAGVLTMFALRGGSTPLEERIALERASKDCINAMIALMQRQNDDIARIAAREPVTNAFFAPIEKAAAALWDTFPDTIRAAICSARSLLYLPSAFGDLSAFPLELLRANGRWIATTHSIARLGSFRTLFELLSPGRMPSRLERRALVVRAQDSKDLLTADVEADDVCRQLSELGLDTTIDRAPHVDTVRAALDRGLRTLHYCGHGFAGPLGEFLFLSATDLLQPYDFSQLSGAGTPFVYLSTCEVGRARMTAVGNAQGIANRLIEKGAPAVIGCLQSVPDLVARTMASSFYAAAATLPVGHALAVARTNLLKFPPACWGVFALFGDPNLLLYEGGELASQTRKMTLRWDSLIGRYLALRTPESWQRAIAAVANDRKLHADGMYEQIERWIESSFGTEEPAMLDARLAVCQNVAERDAVAACELRMLLAMEALNGGYYGARRPDLVANPEELAIGLYCAKAVHDTLAWASFAIESARGSGMAFAPADQLRMLEEAEGILNGWCLEEAAATAMLLEVRNLKKRLLAMKRH